MATEWPSLQTPSMTSRLASSASGCAQLANLSSQFHDFLLLFLDRVEHGPQDRITVHHQITIRVRHYGFRDYLLHCLRSEANVFTLRLNAQSIVRPVLVSYRLQLQDSLQSGVERALDVLQAHIGKDCPRSTSSFA